MSTPPSGSSTPSPTSSTRKFPVFALVVAVSALLLLSLLPQYSTPLFGIVTVASLAVGFGASRYSRRVNGQALPRQELLTPSIHIAPKAAPRDYAYDPAAWPLWQKAAVLWIGLALAFAGQIQIYHDADKIMMNSGIVLMILGVGIIFLMLGGAVLHYYAQITLADFIPPIRLRWRWLALSVGLAIFVSWRSIVKPADAYLGEHILVWLFSMVAFLIAVSPLKGDVERTRNNALKRREYGLLLALIVGAFAVRIINIDRIPPYLDNDEALLAREGASFTLEHFLITPFEPGSHSHPRLFQSMIGVSVLLFGTTLFAARLPSVLLGSLTVAAVYLLGRELRGWQAGLVAALFLLSWAFAVQFSRLALNQSGDPLFLTLAFFFLLRGLRRGSAVDYALSGFALGIAQLFYLGGRLGILVMIAYLIFLWLRQRELIAKQWRLLLIVPAATLLVSLPQNSFLFFNHLPMTTRTENSILFDGQLQENIDKGNLNQYIPNQLKYSFAALIAYPDQSGWFGHTSSMLGLFGGPFFVLGVLMSILVLWKYPKLSLPLGWSLAIVLAFGTLGISPPQYERYVYGIASFSLLVEMGVATFALALARIWQRPQLGRKAALVIGALLCIGNLWFFAFVFVPEMKYTPYRTNWLADRISREALLAYNVGRQVVLVGGYNTSVDNVEIIRYYMMGKPYVTADEPGLQGSALSTLDTGKPATFIVALERQDDLNTLMQLYPGGSAYLVSLDEDKSQAFYVYQAPPSRRPL